MVVPLEDVNASDTDGDGASTTGGEDIGRWPDPSERRTGSDYPINNLHFTVDDDDKNIQRRSYDGLNSMTLKNRH